MFKNFCLALFAIRLLSITNLVEKKSQKKKLLKLLTQIKNDLITKKIRKIPQNYKNGKKSKNK